jgi:hypothetical protein
MLLVDERCLRLIWLALIGLFRSRASLQAEILTLRHQLNVLRRKSPQRLTFTTSTVWYLPGCIGWHLGVLDALKIVRPETVIRWHRAGFRAYWRWKSRPRGGRPKTPLEIRQLIREISLANPLWGAPRIHGELLKLGIDVGQTTVAKYMARGRRPPSQGGRRSFIITPTASRRSTCSWFRQSHSDCSTGCCYCITIAAKSCGWG